MAIKINCIPSGTFPHFLEHEKEETLSVYLEAVKNVIYNKTMSAKMLFSNGNMP